MRISVFFCFLLMLFLTGGLSVSSDAAGKPEAEATITSDELEIRNNGDETIFQGHVILKQDPYLLNADRMVRIKKTGIVTAHGHIDGTWLSEKGEKVKAYGEQGRYEPQIPKTTLWGGPPELIRWETSVDTSPVHIVADRFEALHKEHEFFAQGNVVITQKPKVLTRSEKADYIQKKQIIHLYGSSRVYIHVADTKGVGDFTGDTGWVTLDPKTAHMEGHVIGHVNPSQNL